MTVDLRSVSRFHGNRCENVVISITRLPVVEHVRTQSGLHRNCHVCGRCRILYKLSIVSSIYSVTALREMLRLLSLQRRRVVTISAMAEAYACLLAFHRLEAAAGIDSHLKSCYRRDLISSLAKSGKQSMSYLRVRPSVCLSVCLSVSRPNC